MQNSNRLFKIYIVVIALFIHSGMYLNAQTRKEVQFSLDTLAKKHQSLQKDLKSMKAEWKQQNNFFEHVKKTYFDPTEVNTSIENGIAKFDKIHKSNLDELERLTKINKDITDSLSLYKSTNKETKSENAALNKILLTALNQTSFPQSAVELVGSWNLILNPVQFLGVESEAGIITHNPFVANDSILMHGVYKIDFAEDEIATLYFSGGKSQKSFYSIREFSNNSPYTIKFSKNDDFKLTMYVSPLPSGLMVSYKIPTKSESVYYFYGLMKK